MMYVAVGKEFKDTVSTISWVLKNNPALNKLVLLHVHCPSPYIKMMGASFKPSQLSNQQVNSHRQYEREKMDGTLVKYESFCLNRKVEVERLVVEMSDIAKGIIHLILQNGITNLVMGAAADKNYSKKMKAPKSKTACTVQKEAHPSCKILFVCKGNLIFTRVPSSDGCYGQLPSPVPSSSVTSSSQSMPISPEDSNNLHSFTDQTTSLGAINSEDGSQLIQNSNDTPQVSSTETSVINKEAVEIENVKMEKLTVQQNEAIEEKLPTPMMPKSVWEDVENKPSSSPASDLINSLQTEIDLLRRERDNALPEAKVLQQKKEQSRSSSCYCRSSNFTQFSYSDLEKSTHKFDAGWIIGEGRHSHVYKGYIHSTPVAIKMFNPEIIQNQSEFYQSVDILSMVSHSHPNLVTIIGTCSEASAIVYEFLPNGTLEDHLTHKHSTTPPLPWQVRTSISYEVCCALIALHLANPSGIVHGNLKPTNILFDSNMVSKLSDFGIINQRDLNGNLPYMEDPEFMSTGDLTARSDVYSFGIILLRLITGRPAAGIVEKVQEAVDKGKLQEIMDLTAGDWPLKQTQQLAYFAIRCCDMNPENRPDLVDEVWRLLDQTQNTPLSPSSSFLGSESSKNGKTGSPPAYFICPIFEEIMEDPYVAADGYTYEFQAIKRWIESGKKTSPMTKLKLSHAHLLPNHALRAAIQNWLRQQSP